MMCSVAVAAGTVIAQQEIDEEHAAERRRLEEAERKRSEPHRTRQPSPEELQEIDRRRQEMVDEMNHRAREKKQRLEDLFNKYDTNRSGVLEEDQLKQLLTHLDNSTPEGTPPTDEELDLVLKVCVGKNQRGLSLSELDHALRVWNTYIDSKDKMLERLKIFDKSGTGKLEFKELKQYLKALNGGKNVTDEEVQWVLEEADVFGDGAIRGVEMIMA